MRYGLAGLVLFAASSLSASSLRETTTVEVVEVPVYVRHAGHPVRGLTRENFALFVNGRRQPIEYFDVIDFESPSTDATVDLRQRRLYYLLFDFSSDPITIERARRAADEFIAGNDGAAFFAVGTSGMSHGIQTIVPFTRDRRAVRTAIRALENRSPDPLRLAIGVEARAPESGTFRRPANDLHEPQSVMAELSIEPQRRQTGVMFGALGDLARQLAPIEGHKHVLLFSTGFDGELVHGVRRPRRPLVNWQQGPISADDLVVPAMTLQTDPLERSELLPRPSGRIVTALEAMNAQYAAASVFLHAIDIAGIRTALNGGDNESLHMLAGPGTVVENRNDLAGAIQHLVDHQRVVYILGFHVRRTEERRNQITVRLSGVPRGTTTTYRRSYSTLRERSSFDWLRLADIVTNDIRQSGVSVEARVEEDAGGAVLMASIPGSELLAMGDRVEVDVLMYVYRGLEAVAFRGKAIRIDSQRATALRGRTVQMRERLDLPPGNYTARVLVRVRDVEALGYARTGFTVTP